MARKKLPLGIQTFAEIREGSYIYVDKTLLALRLIAEGKVYFLARPRRFGKSLFLDTLRNLFVGREELFCGLYAEKHWQWNVTYPVIKLDLSGLFDQYEALVATLHNSLSNNARQLKIILRGENNPDRLRNLIADAHQRYGEKVVLLIDEYDKPMIDNVADLALAKEMRRQLHGFYSVIKSADEHLKFVFLTGVSKFSKVSIFSGLNNLEDISLRPEYATICGYTEKDLDDILGDHLQGVDREKLRNWYNGYCFLGMEKVYNPDDILRFLKEGLGSGEFSFENYWFRSGTPSFVMDLLCEKRSLPQRLEQLEADKETLDSCPLEYLNLATVLFQTGYMTISSIDRGDPDNPIYFLSCPNHSVRSSLQKQLFEYYTAHQLAVYRGVMYNALRRGDVEEIGIELKRLFSSIAVDNYRNNPISRYEGYYASVIYSYFVGMGLQVIAEDVSNIGYVDLTILMNDKVYIIEFKMVLNGTLSNRALEQIQLRNYAAKYTGEVYMIGIEFDKNQHNISNFSWQIA